VEDCARFARFERFALFHSPEQNTLNPPPPVLRQHNFNLCVCGGGKSEYCIRGVQAGKGM